MLNFAKIFSKNYSLLITAKRQPNNFCGHSALQRDYDIVQSYSQQATSIRCSFKESADNQDLFEVFWLWRLSGQRKLQDICDMLDQFSIFDGRNVFESFTAYM